jgi:hypothetical protein
MELPVAKGESEAMEGGVGRETHSNQVKIAAAIAPTPLKRSLIFI